MRRRSPGEVVQSFRRRVHGPEGERLRDEMAAWAADIESLVTDAWPEMPSGIADRDADVWEPLLAVADAAGRDWPSRARAAALALVADSKRGTPSLGVKLLADLKIVFGDHDQLSTEQILTELHKIEESPWGDMRGKPMDARGLAQQMRPYDIKPTQVRVLGSVLKGYRRTDLHDSWQRYLGPPLDETATSATGATPATKRRSPRQLGPDLRQRPCCAKLVRSERG